MSALRLPAHEEEHNQATSEIQQTPTPKSDIAYMGGSAEDIDRLNPLALIGAIVAGMGMWGVIIVGLVAIF